ncbi:MAG: AmmeMemoRadiSam system protein A [Oscillospiraceae bacterium]|nr:AmmeMemoRadiSam system protein A [Oscillospiraceae bacterium]
MEDENIYMSTFIVPHPPLAVHEIGSGDELKIQKTLDSYEEISEEIAKIKPETIIFISPHSIMYGDYIHISPGTKAYGDFLEFGAKQVKFNMDYDFELINEINSTCKIENFPAGTLGEKKSRLDHGVMVPMYFINKKYSDYKMVRIGISGLSFKEHYKFGIILMKCIKNLNRKTVIIASGDLSHRLKSSGSYGYSKEGPEFDEKICKIIESNDFSKFFDFSEDFCEEAGECGLRSFIIMAGVLDGKLLESKLLSYEGPFGVGYAIGSFKAIGEDSSRFFLKSYDEMINKKIKDIRKNESIYVSLARRSLEHYINFKKRMDVPKDLPKDMLGKKAGVFVSIKKEGKLRGCIGTISPIQKNIALEIIRNAISSGTNDPRFNPVTEDELDFLEYSVDILDEPESIESKDLLDTKEYGVIVSNGIRSGLLLPNLEGVDTVDEQISIALRKAGISERESYKLQRFKVERYK